MSRIVSSFFHARDDVVRRVLDGSCEDTRMVSSSKFDDVLAISNLIAHSHHLIDSGGSSRLADEVFAAEVDGVVPEADFGFAVWRGTTAVHEGFVTALERFEACMHAVSNLHVDVAGDRAEARYYVQGWHWVKGAIRSTNEADFLVLGVMHDRFVRQPHGWRVSHRRLSRVGPGVAFGRLPDFLAGLGE